jgi:hypothetical protein
MLNIYAGGGKLCGFRARMKRQISSLFLASLPETVTKHVNKSPFLTLSTENPMKALLRLVAEKDGIFINITKNFLATPGFLKQAYRCILNKSGNCASNGFVKKSTFFGSNEQWFCAPCNNILIKNKSFSY